VDLDKLFEKVPYDRIIPIPHWQRWSAVGAVAVAILAAFYFLVVQAKDGEILKLKDDLAKIQKEVDDTRRQAKKITELKEKMVKLEAELAEASLQLPSDKEIPSLLTQISNFGTQAGLEFLQFKPGGEVKRDFYAEVPVSLKLTGKFHNILMFFDEIAHLPRIVTISDIVMKSGGAKKGGSVTTLDVSLQAVTYRFLDTAMLKKPEEKGETGGKGEAPKAGGAEKKG